MTSLSDDASEEIADAAQLTAELVDRCLAAPVRHLMQMASHSPRTSAAAATRTKADHALAFCSTVVALSLLLLA